PGFLRGLSRLEAFGLTYDLLLYPKHLPSAIKVVAEFCDQPFVIDHISKPFIRTGVLCPWKEDMAELAKHPNVFCKISGLVTEAEWGQWKHEQFRPYLDIVFEQFGIDRLMFGSDWPVCLLSGNYEAVVGIVESYTASFGEATRQKLFGLNAFSFYLGT